MAYSDYSAHWAYKDLLTYQDMNQLGANDESLLTIGSRKKLGSFTRDTATASGTQAITGVGFQPSVVIFFQAGRDEGDWKDCLSFGFDDGTTPLSIYYNGNTDNYEAATFSIYSRAGANSEYSGVISALGADGFTINWTKGSGSPTGTITIIYFAFR